MKKAIDGARPLRLIVIGVGGHALVVADAVLRSEGMELLGFVAETEDSSAVLGIAPLLGNEEVMDGLIANYDADAVAVGIGDNHARMTVIHRVRSKWGDKLLMPPIIHPAVVVGTGAAVGLGSVVLAGAVVGAGASIGDGCLVNTGASLDHHSVMEDFSSLGPGVVIGGNVRFGEGAAVSIGAIVLHGRSVGAWSVVGAGATVIDDIPSRVVSYGTPARIVRNREPSDRYL